ncbi:GNAT family N-acetyltransferase [Pedobacter sp. SYSU D00535]|uniref:GNAT family N-acetyltransferase n=1 Tax=Pedobacter sp. SYSU D00535 TaxID=2810308 RepID=UPI001A97B129|nr:GNAT family N-acetyltransferase [Pedobacter sp. SYSU D00535]
MKKLLSSELLTLRPARLGDKIKIFNWLTNSNLTAEMLGPPTFPDNPVPNWEEFDGDYLDYYFDGSQPMKGRCFVLEYEGQEIGQINYNVINPQRKSTEIDIWLADRKFSGKGLGTEAVKILCNYLERSFDCEAIYVAPSSRNLNAIKSYQKAGFIKTDQLPENFAADYADTIVLVRTANTL